MITTDNGVFPDFSRRVDNDIFINEIDFFCVDIVKIITQIEDTKSVDPHGFNNCFFKCLKFALAKPLSICMRIFLQLEKFQVPGVLLTLRQFLLGEDAEASPSIANTLWRV